MDHSFQRADTDPHCSPKHLPRYLAEFDFRYNLRSVSDPERADAALAGVVEKRLTYRDLF